MTINYNDCLVTVQIQCSHKINEQCFLVFLPEKALHLIRREDNEGAYHWFENNANNVSAEAEEIGLLIETKLLHTATK